LKSWRCNLSRELIADRYRSARFERRRRSRQELEVVFWAHRERELRIRLPSYAAQLAAAGGASVDGNG
jgi:hypothetical protein